MTKYEKIKLTLVTVFTVGFLFCFYNYSKNGRYISNETEYTRSITDTRTGTVYQLRKKEKIEIEEFKINKSKTDE